jgi:hypothetical protein
MPKVLPNDAFCKTGNFCIKNYFDFRFCIRQFLSNAGYLTSVSAPKSGDIKNISASDKFRLRQVLLY